MADDKEQRLRELVGVIKEFNIALEQLRQQDNIIDNFKVLVRTDLLRKYNKKWIAYALALELYRILLQDMQRFTSEKQGFIERIRPLDPELAKRIDLLESPPREELEVLEPIAKMLNDVPNVAIGYINTHYQEIMQKLRAFNDKETAFELRRIMILLSGEEIAELHKCINDIRRWTTYRLTNRIDFFTQRLNLYVKGGKDEISGETYLGLASHFKDADLVREIFKIPEVKKLWTYKEEMQFFSWARAVILKSLREEGKWEGFYEFYNNLRRGKRYIEMVRDKFGNPEFANFLERLHEKIHEAPEIWERDLAELSERLHNENYQNMYVIHPAQQALITIFNSRIQQLLAKRGNAINELKVFLDKKINELQNTKLTIQKRFVAILKNKRKKLLNSLNSLRNKLDNKSAIPDARKLDFAHEYVRFIETDLDFSRTITALERINALQISSSNNLAGYASRAQNEFDLLQPLAILGTYLDNLDDLSVIHFNRLELSIDLINRVIAKLHGFIIDLKYITKYNQKLLSFIATNLTEFTVSLKDLRNMKLQLKKKIIEQKPLAA